MEDEAMPTTSAPWTKAETWSLVGKVAFFLVGYAVIGSFQLAWRWRNLRARFL